MSASAMIVKGEYKLTKYYGYKFLPKRDTIIELYNIDNDPEELYNLYELRGDIAHQLLKDLELKIKIADQPYI